MPITKRCINRYSNGSVITNTQLDFANNKGTTNTLVDQVAKSVNDDFNSNSGVFKSNLNSAVDGLTVAALGSSPQGILIVRFQDPCAENIIHTLITY